MNLYLVYFLAFITAFILAVIFTVIVRHLALKFKIVDIPSVDRKIHDKPIPFLGGLAVFASLFSVVFYFAYFTDLLAGKNIDLKNIWAVFIAASLLAIGGFLDDRFDLKPAKQLIWPLLAIIVVIAGGIGITKITNPFGGLIILDQYQWVLFWWDGIPYRLTLLADMFTVVWLFGMMYTVKLLDGLDGLVPGIGSIGAIIIFLLSTTTRWYQPDTALLAIILAGSCLGFLIFNWHPAKIFLGESGPLLIGFMLGVLAIISGAKIATALLIMGVPILDVVWVILRRVFWEHKNPFRTSDRKHLHFRLLDVGLSHRQAVLLLYFLSILFGSLTLFLQSVGKLMALGLVVVVMLVLGGILVTLYKHKNNAK